MPQVRTVWRTSTASNQPQRRLRPVLTPNSLPRRPISSPISFVQFGRERPLPDPGRIGLADPEHIADRARPHAGAGRRLRRHGVGRGDVGIGAVVDVEQRALRALEQDALALAALEVEQPPHRFGVRQKLRRQRGQVFQDSGAVDFLEVEAAAQARCDAPAAGRSCAAACRDRRGPSAGSRGGRPCLHRPGRCRAAWCRSR